MYPSLYEHNVSKFIVRLVLILPSVFGRIGRCMLSDGATGGDTIAVLMAAMPLGEGLDVTLNVEYLTVEGLIRSLGRDVAILQLGLFALGSFSEEQQ